MPTSKTMNTTATELPRETLAAFQNDGLRARIFYEKYALRRDENEILEKTPEEMWKRVAQELAAVESQGKREEREKKFLWLLSDFRWRGIRAGYHPQRPTLAKRVMDKSCGPLQRGVRQGKPEECSLAAESNK